MHSGIYGYYTHDIGVKVKAIELSFDFNTEGNAEERELLQLQPQLAESRIKLQLRDGEDAQDSEIHITRSAVPIQQRASSLKLSESPTPAPDLESLRYEVLKPESLRSGRRYAGYGLPIT